MHTHMDTHSHSTGLGWAGYLAGWDFAYRWNGRTDERTDCRCDTDGLGGRAEEGSSCNMKAKHWETINQDTQYRRRFFTPFVFSIEILTRALWV